MSFPTVTVTETATVTVTGPTTLQVVTVGVPGTPGTGSVTTAQYNALNATVTSLSSGPVAWSNTTVSLANGGATPLSPDNVATPVLTEMASAGTYADSTGGTIVQLAAEAKNSGTRPAVAVLGEAIATGATAVATGGLFKGLGNVAGATATGVEIDYGNLVAAGPATGLLVKASGVAATTAAIKVSSAAAAAAPATGLLFDAAGGAVATSALIGTANAPSVPIGLDLSGGVFSSAPLLLPNNSAIAAKTSVGSTFQILGLDAANQTNIASGNLTVNSVGKTETHNGFSPIGGVEGGYILLDALGLSTAGVQSTSSLSTYAAALTRSYTLPSGTWTVLLVGVCIFVGNSSSDDVQAHLSNDTTEASGSLITGTPGQDNTTYQMVGTLTGLTGGPHNYFIGYHSLSTGTMNAAKPVLLIFGRRTA